MSRFLIALAVVASSSAASALDFADVVKRGTLRVLVMVDTRRPEFFAVASGSAPGFDQEVLDGFVGLHKVKLQPVTVASWDALIPALLDGKGDIIAGRFTDTEARRKAIAFTNEVFPTRNVVLTRKPHAAVTTVEQLRKEKVGTIRGTSMAEAITKAGVPDANVDDGIPAGGFAEALKSGRISAAVWGVESAIAAQKDDPELQIGAFIGPPASLAYGVRKQDTQLLAALDEYIDNVRRTPTWSRLVVKYFGDAAPDILKKARSQ